MIITHSFFRLAAAIVLLASVLGAARGQSQGRLDIRLELLDPVVCAGTSARVRARATGGVPNTYVYDWSTGAGSGREVTVANVTADVTLTVDVTDVTGATGSAELTIRPREAATILDGDRQLCGSDPRFELAATPSGGRWFARGMARAYDRSDPLYQPNLVKEPTDEIVYIARNGCRDTVTFAFTPLDDGTDDAACTGAAPFTVSGGQPEGGSWTSAQPGAITADGVFDPAVGDGQYPVTYTAPNGCAGTKVVTVGPLVPVADTTVCESVARLELAGVPFGGTWSGTGITSTTLGWFDPGRAGPGQHVLTYRTEGGGCTDELTVTVVEVDAGTPSITTCPAQEPFALTTGRPAGGTWSGLRVNAAGQFDPGLAPEENYISSVLYTAPNGCTDSLLSYNYSTYANAPEDTTLACIGDPILELTSRELISFNPAGGTWTSAEPGLVFTGDTVRFDPSLSTGGVSNLVYEANGCRDTVVVRVGTAPGWTGDTICVDAEPRDLVVAPAPDIWYGDGITDYYAGTFDPSLAGLGAHSILAITDIGCVRDRDIVVVDTTAIPYLAPDPTPCYSSVGLDLGIDTARTAVFEGTRRLAPKPATAALGAGPHTLRLEQDQYGCLVTEEIPLEVRPPLALVGGGLEDSYCYQAEAALSVTPSGGLSDGYTVRWSDDATARDSFARTITLYRPDTIRATLGDGCSDSVVYAFGLNVGPPILASVEPGPTVCFGESTYAIVSPADSITFETTWRLPDSTTFTGDEYAGTAGAYPVTLNATALGCTVDTVAVLPSYAQLIPSFAVDGPIVDDGAESPACRTVYQPRVEVADSSAGADAGRWSLSDGRAFPYLPGAGSLAFDLKTTGTYTLTLELRNGENCTAADSVVLCATDPELMFFPTAFTPNDDGLNDTYHIAGLGVKDIEWAVYDRWGQVLYSAGDFNAEWDGTHQGKPVVGGTYTVRASYASAAGERRHKTGAFVLIR